MLTAAAWLAAITTRLRLVLAVLVVPHRPAVLAAKQLATIDVLSGGRLTVGIGAGWLEAEFDAVVDDAVRRARRGDRRIRRRLQALWTEKKPRIAGRYVHFDGLLLEPKPVQKPHPPIWVGGESGPSVAPRRAARRRLVSDRHQQRPSARTAAALPRRHRAAAPGDRGRRRDPRDAVALTYRVKRYGDAVPARASDGERRLFSGSDADIVGDIRALARSRRHRHRFRFRAPARQCLARRNAAVSRKPCWPAI